MSNGPVIPDRETMQWLVAQGRKVESMGSVSGAAGVPLHRASSGGIRWDGYLWIPTSSGTRVPVAANADTTKINVHVNKSGSPVVTETNDPVPSSWGPDEFWYVKAKLSGMVIVP
jgi:hypothetical protein